jgi:hypothetical protein
MADDLLADDLLNEALDRVLSGRQCLCADVNMAGAFEPTKRGKIS